MNKKLCIISVISDVYTDQRVLRTADTLNELNYSILIIGRKTKHTRKISKDNTSTYQIQHIQTFFKKGVPMYTCFNLILFTKLFFLIIKHKKYSVLLYANDLDTLLPNYIIARLFHLPIIYDSHEIFTEVPELQDKKIKKKIWEKVEGYIVPKLSFAITVNQSIASWYQKKYNTAFYPIRNISTIKQTSKIKNRDNLQLPLNKKIIILQGTGINIHRGAEELIQAMQYLDDNYLLLIIGSGDVMNRLRKLTHLLQLNNKIIFKDRMPANELHHYTCNADIGVSIDKPNNLNYLYSLPNKIFSYIHAHIPILASRLPEIEKIIKDYQIGTFIENHQPQHIAARIEYALNHHEYQQWKKNTYEAERELNWEKEKELLKNIIKKHINH